MWKMCYNSTPLPLVHPCKSVVLSQPGETGMGLGCWISYPNIPSWIHSQGFDQAFGVILYLQVCSARINFLSTSSSPLQCHLAASQTPAVVVRRGREDLAAIWTLSLSRLMGQGATHKWLIRDTKSWSPGFKDCHDSLPAYIVDH